MTDIETEAMAAPAEAPDAPAAGTADTVIDVPEKATLDESVTLRDRLKPLLGAEEVVFDASKAETVSTPYILTMVSFLTSRDESLPKVAVQNAPPAFVDAFTDLGLFQDLMKMEFRT